MTIMINIIMISIMTMMMIIIIILTMMMMIILSIITIIMLVTCPGPLGLIPTSLLEA